MRPIDLYQGRDDILAIFEDETDIYNINPKFNLLADINSRGLIVTTIKEYDFISRYFSRCGVNEDPVTGSAHTTLIPYWSKVLNKSKMLAKQVSQRGILHCDISGGEQ